MENIKDLVNQEDRLVRLYTELTKLEEQLQLTNILQKAEIFRQIVNVELEIDKLKDIP
jgi:hypothetical protein